MERLSSLDKLLRFRRYRYILLRLTWSMMLLFVIDILPRELIPPRYYRITGNPLVLTMCQEMLELYLWLFGMTKSVRAQRECVWKEFYEYNSDESWRALLT
jgi:hypothetical protein